MQHGFVDTLKYFLRFADVQSDKLRRDYRLYRRHNRHLAVTCDDSGRRCAAVADIACIGDDFYNDVFGKINAAQCRYKRLFQRNFHGRKASPFLAPDGMIGPEGPEPGQARLPQALFFWR